MPMVRRGPTLWWLLMSQPFASKTEARYHHRHQALSPRVAAVPMSSAPRIIRVTRVIAAPTSGLLVCRSGGGDERRRD